MRSARWLYWTTLLVCLVFCIANGRWMSWILLLAVAALPWLSLLLSLWSMFTARIELQAPRLLQIGDSAAVSIRLQTKGVRLPAATQLQVKKPLTGETLKLKLGTPLPTDHCGGLVITPRRAKCSDLLGLWRHSIKQVQPITVYVFPQERKQEPPTGLEQHLSVSWRPKPGGGYAEQYELREYRPGDSLNQIHWKLTAKTGDFIIREPMTPLLSRMVLTLDLNGTPQVLDDKLGRLLWLGNYLLRQNLTFSVMALTGDGVFDFPVGTARDLQACMEQLLCAPIADAGTILEQLPQAAWRYHIGGAADEA